MKPIVSMKPIVKITVPSLAAALVVAVSAGTGIAADGPRPGAVHALSVFGPLDTPANVQATFERAVQQLREGDGGVLLVPPSAWRVVPPVALQGLVREPAPPSETKRWRDGAGVTVVTGDARQTIVAVPPLSGARLERQLRLTGGDSLPHWGTHPLLTLDSRIIHGSSSYLDWLQAPAAKGPDRRFYVPTIRGLWPGQFLNVHGGPGYGGGVTRAVVKSLGYDAEKRLPYFVADTSLEHVPGAIAHNKSNTGLIHMLQSSHADNQTYDVKVIRNQYAHGDTYIYYCDFNYMSNVHSAAGDENGNCYGAFIRSLDNNFRGAVESLDWATSRLTFAAGATHVESLGNSRPLINLNPKKQITAGTVLIVNGRTEFDLGDTPPAVFGGKDYSTGLVTNPVTGVRERRFGGLIRGDRDCPWTADVVGRYFAVDEPSEKTPRGNFRWYLITRFQAQADGTKAIEIQRFWWGAKSAGSPTLYRTDNYTWDGHVRPLRYCIAPGAYVNDVSDAVAGGDRGGRRRLGLAPHAAQGTAFDFQPGDRVEQAIGADPFKPEAFRVWMWEDVPGQYPAAVFDIANHGATSRYSVLTVAGGSSNLEDLAKRHEPKPAWDNIFVLNSAAGVGLNLRADFATAAILFQQPNREQPIQWHYGHAADHAEQTSPAPPAADGPAVTPAPQVASLTVSRTTGTFQFAGGGLDSGGPVSGVTGLSGDARPARNLRGKNIGVAAGQTTLRIRFPRPEADGDYAVFVEQSWLTHRAIRDKRPEGFTIAFATAAPEKATLDWMLVR